LARNYFGASKIRRIRSVRAYCVGLDAPSQISFPSHRLRQIEAHYHSYKSVAVLPHLKEVTFIMAGDLPGEDVIARVPWRLGPHSSFEAEKHARKRLQGELRDWPSRGHLRINFKSIHDEEKRDAGLPSPLDYSRITYRDQVEALEAERFVQNLTRRL
jgi:hypothetical protein